MAKLRRQVYLNVEQIKYIEKRTSNLSEYVRVAVDSYIRRKVKRSV